MVFIHFSFAIFYFNPHPRVLKQEPAVKYNLLLVFCVPDTFLGIKQKSLFVKQ